MALSTESVFINENDDLFTILQKYDGIFNHHEFPQELAFLFNKQNNNYVGYAIFGANQKQYKVFVLPKIIKNPNIRLKNEQDVIQQFVKYLIACYRLDKNSKKVMNYIEWSNASKKTNAEIQAQDLDDFREYKYSQLLEEVRNFFRTHRARRTINVSYTSQTIRHRLNLAKNITSLDKSHIHQERADEIVFSELAKVTYAALRLFQRQKSELLNKRKGLKQQVDTLSTLLLQKFNVPRGYQIHLQALTTNAMANLFQKSLGARQLYRNILMLFGLERFWDEQDANVSFDVQGDYFFFRPENVYEKLVEEYFNKDRNGKKTNALKKDSVSYVANINTKSYSTDSTPDLIIQHNDSTMTIVDAKWKILDLNSKSNPLNVADILKLERDRRVRLKSEGSIPKMMLAYCKILGLNKTNNEKIIMKINYTENDVIECEIKEISFDL